MRYLAVGLAGIAAGALIAAPTAVYVDRSQRPTYGNELVQVYVAKEFIPKGTLITRNDLYTVTYLRRKDVEGRPMPVIPWVGSVATVDIRPGDPHTIGDFRDQ